MDEQYVGQNEISSIFELVLVIAFMCVGVVSIQQHVRYLSARTVLTENFDKVSAQAEYEEVADKVFKFTPQQAYILGYFMESQGPNLDNSVRYVGISTDAERASNTPGVSRYCDVSPKEWVNSAARGTYISTHVSTPITDYINPSDNTVLYYRNLVGRDVSFKLVRTNKCYSQTDVNNHVEDKYRWAMISEQEFRKNVLRGQ